MIQSNLNQSPLAGWLKHIESFHPNEIDLGLERIRKVADKLKILKNSGKLIIVGGTNGKGSCVATLDAIARTNGLSVLSYTSPHLVAFNERVRVDGELVDDELLISAFEAIEEARDDTALTFFEFTTLAALWINSKILPDLTILEVGLGGRLDAVNIMEPDASVITTIAFDHTDWLGGSLSKIAYEKAGISRANKTTFVGDKNSYQLLAELTEYKQASFELVRSADNTERKALSSLTVNPNRLLEQNVLLAVEAFKSVFAVDNIDLASCLLTVKLAGRFQLIASQPKILVDVGHNPQAAENLQQQIRRFVDQERISDVKLVCGMMRDKAIGEVLSILDPVASSWHFVDLEGERAASGKSIEQEYQERGLCKPTFVYESVKSAIGAITQHTSSEQMILGFGSFITVGNMIQYIETY